MPKSIAVLFFSFFLSLSLHAQQMRLTGTVKDTTKTHSVKNAVVALVTQKDSVLTAFVRTQADGGYQFNALPSGKYVLMVTHPSFADYVEDIEIADKNITLPGIALTPKSKLLEAVIVRSGGSMRIKGDTTIYTADSFKVSANANVEELLRKMPGIQVDKNGEIKAMGETVEKVLVDGEEFFGDDPGMAVKNLRADAVKEVQVFKKKSDQAEFTGIDDGQSKQTINLKLKEDKKHGYFGKIDLAGGLQKKIEDRYNTNTLFGSFKGKRKLSAFVLNGNSGQEGLSWDDMQKYDPGDINIEMSDDGSIMMMRMGSSSDDGYVDTENGFFNILNSGISYNNTFNGKNKLYFSPRFKRQLYHKNTGSFSRTYIGDSILNQNGHSSTHVNRWNGLMGGSYDMKLDSNNSLKISVNAGLSHNKSESDIFTETTGASGNLKNIRDRKSSSTSDRYNFGMSALYKRKFAKARRTLSLTANWTQNQSNSDNYALQNITDYTGQGLSENLDQLIATDNITQNLSSKIVYTEPLSKTYSLELSHQFSLNKGSNDQRTFNYSSVNHNYDQLVDSLTNDFEQSIWENRPSVKISYNTKKTKFNFGMATAFTQFDLRDNSLHKKYNRHYTNYFPSAMFQYRYKTNSNFQIDYNGRTQQPSINQLQPLRNISDKYSQYIGNPNLRQSFTNAINLSNNSYNFLSGTYLYQNVHGSITSNGITNNRTTNPVTGFTINQPINTNGNFSVGINAGGGLEFKKQAINLNFNFNANYSRSIDVINSKRSASKNTSIGFGPRISKYKDKKYEISLSNNVGLNYNKNEQYSGRNQFLTNNLEAELGLYIKKKWKLNSDYNFTYQGKASPEAKPYQWHSWNAKLQRHFKKEEFTAYFLVRDILNQNIGLSRSFSGNNYYETRNERLKRYWMLGFTWNFKNKAPKAKETASEAGSSIELK